MRGHQLKLNCVLTGTGISRVSADIPWHIMVCLLAFVLEVSLRPSIGIKYRNNLQLRTFLICLSLRFYEKRPKFYLFLLS